MLKGEVVTFLSFDIFWRQLWV